MKLSTRITLGVFLCFLIAEYGLRLIPLERFAFRAWEAASMYAVGTGPFEPLAEVEIPESRGALGVLTAEPEFHTTRPERFTTDQCGFRNSPKQPKELPTKVLLLGDSFIAGSGVSDHESPSSVLEDLLQVGVYQVSHHKADAQFLGSLKQKLEMQSDILILLLSEHSYRWFLLNSSDKEDICSEPPELLERRKKIRYAELMLTKSRLEILSARLLRHVKNDWLLPSDVHGRGYFVTLTDGSRMLLGARDAQLSSERNDEVALAEQVLEFREQLQVQGLELRVLLAPGAFTSYFPLMRDPPYQLPEKSYLSRLEVELAKRDISVLNTEIPLSEAALQAYRAGTMFYWRDDIHWTAEGVRFIMERVSEWLQTDAAIPQREESPH